jgi:hypothetical protein
MASVANRSLRERLMFLASPGVHFMTREAVGHCLAEANDVARVQKDVFVLRRQSGDGRFGPVDTKVAEQVVTGHE